MERRQEAWARKPVETQEKVFQNLMVTGKATVFGADHHLSGVNSYADFKQAVPIRDYEDLIPYIDRVKAGEANVLWKGRPLYFAKTSGTTSGVKYIPISREGIPNHVTEARNSVLSYIHGTGKSRFMDFGLIFLSGSPILDQINGIHTGRLSGIVNHHVPNWIRSHQIPDYKTNCIEDWEAKLDRIVDLSISRRIGMVSGIPPWVQMYFDRIRERSGKAIKDIFPDFSLMVFGGVNFEPYRNRLFDTIGKKIDTVELYPASEGFFAYQDSQEHPGMLLLLNSGIFYEFIPADEFYNKNPTRLGIEDVKTGVNYAMIISTNSGLWGYSMGDTVKFVSTKPYRVVVTGRIRHFISAFGEHVIGEEVEQALKNTMLYHPETEVVEFTVAPQVTPSEGLPHHEWLIEFGRMPANMPAFERRLDEQLRKLNTYYNDLISGRVLEQLHITRLKPEAFRTYMKLNGKLGGQNKVPRLSNDRLLADELSGLKL
ncbi:MAG: GH3 auxin-responsive promoter family protein [Bacteroidota bacterium]